MRLPKIFSLMVVVVLGALAASCSFDQPYYSKAHVSIPRNAIHSKTTAAEFRVSISYQGDSYPFEIYYLGSSSSGADLDVYLPRGEDYTLEVAVDSNSSFGSQGYIDGYELYYEQDFSVPEDGDVELDINIPTWSYYGGANIGGNVAVALNTDSTLTAVPFTVAVLDLDLNVLGAYSVTPTVSTSVTFVTAGGQVPSGLVTLTDYYISVSRQIGNGKVTLLVPITYGL